MEQLLGSLNFTWELCHWGGPLYFSQEKGQMKSDSEKILCRAVELQLEKGEQRAPSGAREKSWAILRDPPAGRNANKQHGATTPSENNEVQNMTEISEY